MSIVPLVKTTLYGPAREKDEVLDGLQRLGCVHLNDLNPHSAEDREAPASWPDAREAIQYLQDSPVRRHGTRPREDADLKAVIRDTIAVRDRSRALEEERTQLRRWIADREPWGEFEMPEWGREGRLRFWFYAVPHYRMDGLQAIDLPWRAVSRDHRFSYVVVVAAGEPAGMPAAPLCLDPRPLSQLRSRLEAVECELEELDYRRIGLTLYLDTLRMALDEADDRAVRERAGRRTIERDQVFAVQGWAPCDRASSLRQFASDRGLAVTVEVPGPREAPPTLLRNPSVLRGGEDMMTFYKTPGYSMWDPSTMVFLSFAVFFGMIFSDAGYGLVLGILLIAGWKRLGRSESGRGMRGVLTALVTSSVVYGILVGSYFGWIPPKDSLLGRLHVLDAENQAMMMLISVGIGVAHLTYANLVAAWQRRRSLSALSGVGWACILLGGFCLGLGKGIPSLASLSSPAWAGLGLGVLLVLFFTSGHPFSLAPRALLERLLEGLKGVTELSKAFGDVLSYLRLFALGLASIKLAEVFNSLAGNSFESRGAGVLLGLVVLLVGHAINFSMGILSGVVHGLRLNLIEFFNWSLPEEGERFQTYAKKAGG